MELDALQVRDAIRRLFAAQPEVFGANCHHFGLNPPLPEAAVKEFEYQHGVSLPRDYRYFMTQISNGGAGPYCGIFPLGEMDAISDSHQAWQENDGFVGALPQPFPLRVAWNDLSGMPADELEHRDEADYWRRKDAFNEKYWDASRMNGAIPICHEGCALRVWLVVSGPESGRLWRDYRADCRGVFPLLLKDGSRATFSAWYAAWLEEVLQLASG